MNLKPGDRIELVKMVDDPDPIEPGTLGTVNFIVQLGTQQQVDVDWDDGRALMLIVPPDRYRILDKEEAQ